MDSLFYIFFTQHYIKYYLLVIRYLLLNTPFFSLYPFFSIYHVLMLCHSHFSPFLLTILFPLAFPTFQHLTSFLCSQRSELSLILIPNYSPIFLLFIFSLISLPHLLFPVLTFPLLSYFSYFFLLFCFFPVPFVNSIVSLPG